MRCGHWTILLLLLLVMVAGFAQAPERPALPRDTLPAKLSIDLVPLGLEPNRPVPEDNPLTEAKVQLGRRLFFDPILSVDRTVSCASCHDPRHGFAGTQPTPLGVHGRRGTRNAPSLFNVAYGSRFFWDGRAASLEEQALEPIQRPDEMGNTLEEVLKRLASDPGYRRQFEAAFPDGVTAENLARAIACFERTLLLGNSRPDAFTLSANVASLGGNERHGMWLFASKGRCWRCHSGRNFTDNDFHNTGVAWFKTPSPPGGEGWGEGSPDKPLFIPTDLGRYGITKLDTDRGKFKTPALRGVAHTAPYMHDGSLATLEEVVEFYNRGGGKNPNLDPVIVPLGLSLEERTNLVTFLKALSLPAEPQADAESDK